MAEVGQYLLARRICPHKRVLINELHRDFASNDLCRSFYLNPSKRLAVTPLAPLTHSLIYTTAHVCFEIFEIRRTHPLSLQVRYRNNNGSWFQLVDKLLICFISLSHNVRQLGTKQLFETGYMGLPCTAFSLHIFLTQIRYFLAAVSTSADSWLRRLFSTTLSAGYRSSLTPRINKLRPWQARERAGEDIKRRQEGATKGVSRDNADSAAP